MSVYVYKFIVHSEYILNIYVIYSWSRMNIMLLILQFR